MFEFLYNDTKRAEKYLEFEKSLKELDSEIGELARIFNSTIKDFRIAALSTEDKIVKSSIHERSEFFKKQHLKSVGEVKRKRDKLTKSIQALKTDSSKFIEVVEKSKKKEAFDTILKSYREGVINTTACDSLIKAKTKEKVRYADNIVINEKGLILLLKRSEIDDSHPGYYTVPGGHVDLGEDCETAAKRELEEEAGIKVEEVIKVGEYEDEKCRIEYFQSNVENIEPVLQEEEIWSYEWVNPKDISKYNLPFNMGENLTKILLPFKHQIIQIKKSFNMGFINEKTRDNLIGVVVEKAKNNDLEKAWKAAQIGEIRTHGDGKKYKKVSETGNSLKDWQLVVDSKAGSSQEDTNGKQGNKQDTTEKQPTAKELVEHAKNTSETSLNTAIKESDDPKLREVAHNELERRQKEEKLEDSTQKNEKEEKTTTEKKSRVDYSRKPTIQEKVEELSDKYKDLMKQGIEDDFSDLDKTTELSKKQKEYSRYIQRLKEFEGVDKQIEISKAEDLLGLRGEKEIKDFFGDGEIQAISVEDEFVTVLTEDAYCQRGFDKNGTVDMLEFILNPDLDKGVGRGSEIFFNQVNSFKEKGFKKLNTDAAGGSLYNGYYTWARLGYSPRGPIGKAMIKLIVQESSDKDVSSVESLSELMSFKKGRDFWKKSGSRFSGEFDLSDSSESMFILNKYMEEKKNAKK